MKAPRTALPGLVKLYLASLYATVLSLALLAAYLIYFFSKRYYSELGDYVPAFFLAAFGGAGLWNIIAIHKRLRRAPAISCSFLGLIVIFGGIAGVVLLYSILDYFTMEHANLWAALVQGLVPTVAWFLYWKYSPKAGAAFGAFVPKSPMGQEPGWQLLRLAGVYILVTGFCYSVTFLIYHFDYLPNVTANPGHWLLFGLAATVLLFFPRCPTQKNFDRLGLLLIIWIIFLACMWLLHLWIPVAPDIRYVLTYFPGTGFPLPVESVMVIAMFWYVVRRRFAYGEEGVAAVWVRLAQGVKSAGVRGLDVLCLALFLFIMGNTRRIYDQPVAYSVYMGIFGCGLLAAVIILVVRPSFFIPYMRYFTAAAPIAYVVMWGGIGLGIHGPAMSFIYAVEWNNVIYMLLGALYCWLRERITAHPAMVFMRFAAWGCIALSCVMLIHVPTVADLAEDGPSALWYALNVGLPWLCLPFAAGLLYTGRGRSGWDGLPGRGFIISVVGLIAMLCIEKFLALIIYALPRRSWEFALADAVEPYAYMVPVEQGTAFALALCLWALSFEKRNMA